jgi:hypothetical protein
MERGGEKEECRHARTGHHQRDAPAQGKRARLGSIGSADASWLSAARGPTTYVAAPNRLHAGAAACRSSRAVAYG